MVGLNRQQLQRQADKEKRLRRLERKLDRVNWRRKWETRISIVLLAALLVLAGFFAARVTPVRVDGGTSTQPQSISFTRSHVEWLDENYNLSEENGFCLFGHRDGDRVMVEQVEFVDNPIRQSYKAMSFTCIPQILARSKNLILQEDYELVGAIHTHPETYDLSWKDRDTFRFVDPFLSVFGVYKNGSLQMYSSPGQREPITNVLRVN